MTETATKERPIIFTGESVRAILEGRKTQTRRVLKPQPDECTTALVGPEWYTPAVVDRWGELQPAPADRYGVYDEDGDHGWPCPYGAPGDVLWVREAFAYHPNRARYPQYALWKASWDDQEEQYKEGVHGIHAPLRWRSPIHMPRWASRLSLRVVDVRVERLRAISDSDLWAEGVADPDDRAMVHLVAFSDLWDEINARRGFSWESNPWVWVVTFEVIR